MMLTKKSAIQTIRSRVGGSRSGQVMLEYLMVVVVSFGVIIITALLYYVFKEHGGRILDLAASEYP